MISNKLGKIYLSDFLRRKMPIKVVLIDLSGTLHIDDEPTPSAVKALKKLRDTNITIKFVTNTTKECRQTLFNRLLKIGFDLCEDEIHSSLTAAANYVCEHHLNPYYLVSSDARKDFPLLCESRELNSVVVGLAPNEFNYENLNKAFNILISNKEHQLIAIHEGKYYKRSNELALGPGFFVKGLEYATNSKAILIGKPNPLFFKSALPKNSNPMECVMIGDDAKDDVVGAINVGMKGILVKTGKYLPNVKVNPPPDVVVENFSEAVDWIIDNCNN